MPRYLPSLPYTCPICGAAFTRAIAQLCRERERHLAILAFRGG